MPEPTARTGPPKKPAKNRVTSRDPKLCEKPAPRVNSMNSNTLVLYTIDRPYVSLGPAATVGPKPSPSTYKDSVRIAAVRDTLNSFSISTTPGVMMDEAIELLSC